MTQKMRGRKIELRQRETDSLTKNVDKFRWLWAYVCAREKMFIFETFFLGIAEIACCFAVPDKRALDPFSCFSSSLLARLFTASVGPFPNLMLQQSQSYYSADWITNDKHSNAQPKRKLKVWIFVVVCCFGPHRKLIIKLYVREIRRRKNEDVWCIKRSWFTVY